MTDPSRLAELQTERETCFSHLTHCEAQARSNSESATASVALKIEAARQHLADFDAVIEAIKAGAIA
jgi:hypothetical protein